ncbi:MAG: acyl--CoA ligase [Opitutaceae bacterium]|nr:acyl--CoA ligase [Opitutaceae bacterium]
MPDPLTDKPWLVMGETGVQSSYAELVSELRSTELEVRRIARPASTSEGLRLLCHALVAEVEMTLVDPLFHPGELAQLGIDATQFATVRWVPGRSELVRSELMRLAGGGSRMRLGLFTSGSTGVPSRVEHSLGTLARNVRIGARHAADIWALTFRPTHIAGVQVWLQALANGNTLVDLTGVPPREALEAMAVHGVTHISASPTYYRSLLGTRMALPGVRSVSLGGELVSSELLSQLRPLFPAARIHNIYASTEAGTLLESAGDLFRIPDDKRTVIEIKDCRLHVHRSLLGKVDEKQKTESGHQNAASGVQTAMPHESQLSAFNFQLSEWYDTGDLVDEVEPGHFRFVARERDWANIGGTKVNPHEVEEAIREHPGVKEARVSAQLSSVTGQLLAAEVVLAAKPPVNCEKLMDGGEKVALPPGKGELLMDSGSKPENPLTNNQSPLSDNQSLLTNNPSPTTAPQLSEAELRAWLAARLHPAKIPRIIRFVMELPTTYSGKTSRK